MSVAASSSSNWSHRAWIDRSGVGINLARNALERVTCTLNRVLIQASCRAAALRSGVSVSYAVKWTQLYRFTGCVDPMPRAGRGSVLDAQRDFLLERLRTQPHVTVSALRDELAERRVTVFHNAVGLFLRRKGMTHKKRLARAGAIKSRHYSPPQALEDLAGPVRPAAPRLYRW